MIKAARPAFRTEAAGIFAVYLVLTALTFARLWPHLQTDAIVKSPFDFGPNLWLQWWGPFAAGRGLDPLRTSWMYYPAGAALSVDAGAVQWVLAALLRIILNPVGIYNVLAALSYLVTGVASYALFRLYARPAGALLGSLAFTFSAYRNYNFLVNQTDLLQMQWCVLLILAFVLYARPERAIKSWGWLLASAVLACGADPRSLLMTMLFLAVWTAAALREDGRAGAGRGWTLASKALILASAVALCSLPMSLPSARVIGLWPGTRDVPNHYLVGWRNLILFPEHHALYAGSARSWHENNEGYWSLGLLALTLAGLTRCRERRDVRPFAAALGVFAVLAASRRPLAHLPVLGLLHVPARFSLITTLCASVFVSLGWEWAAPCLAAWLRRPLWGLLAAATFLETNPVLQRPRPVWKADEPALDALRNFSGAGAVIDLPLSFSPGIAGAQPNFQAFLRATRHERPMLNGSLSYPWPGVSELLGRPDLQNLFACQEKGVCGAFDDAAWGRLRRDEGVRFVIVDKREPATPLTAALVRAAAVRRFASDGDLDIYEIEGGPDEPARGLAAARTHSAAYEMRDEVKPEEDGR